MYEVDALINNKYFYICENENINDINMAVLELSLKNIPCRILKDGLLMIFLDGSMEQYNYFSQMHILNENKKR